VPGVYASALCLPLSAAEKAQCRRQQLEWRFVFSYDAVCRSCKTFSQANAVLGAIHEQEGTPSSTSEVPTQTNPWSCYRRQTSSHSPTATV
jgi:hypothetical protein